MKSSKEIISDWRQLPFIGAHAEGWPWIAEVPQYNPQIRWPRICIVIPSFKQGAYIEETIRSILLQGYPNLQLLVMDAGSKDKTIPILEQYSPWIDHWESEPDRGQSHAINKGLARMDGEWFNWINSDDFLEEGALLSIGRLAAENSDALVIAGKLRHLSPKGELSTPRGIDPNASIIDQIVNHKMCQPSIFYKLGNSLRVDESRHYVMDFDLWSRTILEFGFERVAMLEKTVAVFREHDSAKTSVFFAKFEEEERSVLRTIGRGVGCDRELLEVLSNCSRDDEIKVLEGVSPRSFGKAVTRRFLLGDLRKQAYSEGKLLTRLMKVCFRYEPFLAILYFVKARAKKTLKMHLDK